MYCCMSLQLYCLLFVITCPFWNRCLSTICVAITSCLSRHCGWYLFRFVCPHIYILTYIYRYYGIYVYIYLVLAVFIYFDLCAFLTFERVKYIYLQLLKAQWRQCCGTYIISFTQNE